MVVGDSVAEGIGDPVPGYVNQPWADRVAAELTALAPEFEYRNLGRRNLPAAQVRAEQLAPALDFAPDLALVGCGYDALRRAYDGDAVDRELAAIITPLLARGTAVITVSLLVFEHYPRISAERLAPLLARLREHADRTAKVAATLGTIHVDLRGHPGQRDPGMLSADGLHANGRAHGLCAAAVVRRLGEHLTG